MSFVLYNAGKIKSFENLRALSLMVGETEEFATDLWKDMLADSELLDEFNYFVANHTIRGTMRCGELTLLDIYFSQMNKYNILHDMGKNPYSCSKERLVLHAFKQITEMRKDPNYMANYLKNERSGMDIDPM